MVIAPPIDIDAHEVFLGGAWSSTASPNPGPTLVETTEDDFVRALLEALGQQDPGPSIAAMRPMAPAGGSTLRLFQPVHRVFNMVLVEAHCVKFGNPRLNPRKIESAGIVVRRLAGTPDAGGASSPTGGRRVFEGWMSNKGKATGWIQLSPEDEDADPEPLRRRRLQLTPDAMVDSQFLGARPTREEEHGQLFVAPPDTVAACGRTVLYGVLPVTSPAQPGEPAAGPEPTDAEWYDHLEVLLKPAQNPSMGIPSTGNWNANDSTTFRDTLLMRLIRQLAQEFRLFDQPRSPEATRAIDELNQLSVPVSVGPGQPMGSYLDSVVRVLRGVETGIPPVPYPSAWPTITDAKARAIAQRLRAVAGEALRGMLRGTVTPVAGRFEDRTRQYAARAFIRVRCPDGCPPRLVWSGYSEPFEIAPWYESGPAKPVVVPLPDPFDRNFLNRAKPGVAFSVPARLANFVNQDPKDMLGGTLDKSSNFVLDWICGFNIPIITICAFIVLSIFLSLFDIVLRWLFFVKICIPFPRKK